MFRWLPGLPDDEDVKVGERGFDEKVLRRRGGPRSPFADAHAHDDKPNAAKKKRMVWLLMIVSFHLQHKF